MEPFPVPHRVLLKIIHPYQPAAILQCDDGSAMSFTIFKNKIKNDFQVDIQSKPACLVYRSIENDELDRIRIDCADAWNIYLDMIQEQGGEGPFYLYVFDDYDKQANPFFEARAAMRRKSFLSKTVEQLLRALDEQDKED